MGVAPDDRTFLQKLQGLLVPATQEGRQFNTDLGLSLLANSGYSATPRTFGQTLGVSALQAQQAAQERTNDQMKRAYMEAQIKAMQAKPTQSPFGAIDPDQFTPESLADFQKTGDYGVLKPRGGLSGVGNFNPGDYTPESFAKFMKSQNPADLVRYNAPANPYFAVINGVGTNVQPTRGGGPTVTTPLTTLDREAAAAADIAAAKSRGTATGTATGEAEGGAIKKAIAANGVLSTLDIADPLIDVATGSAGGAAVDKVAGFFGKSLTGAKAIAQLKILQTNLVLSMPRMEGPQSNFDAQMYVEAAGSIGDPTVPREQKKAAIQTIRQLQKKYATPSNASPSGYQIAPEGSDAAKSGEAANIQQLIEKYSK